MPAVGPRFTLGHPAERDGAKVRTRRAESDFLYFLRDNFIVSFAEALVLIV